MMKRYLNKLPKRLQDLINLIRQVAYHNNMPAYLVGGFVRDLILGVANLDLDITVEGDGLNFALQLANRLNASLIRHRRFGTATLITPDKTKIDIATARREFYVTPASLPIVEPGSIRDDLKRRDFTINAIAIRIFSDNFLKVIDFFNGHKDIRKKNICVLHDLSFIDDPTRILRAIRFEQRYKFRIERKTLRLLKEAVSLNMLNKVNPHRLRDEIVLILKEDNPVRYIRRMKNLTGFSFITPHFNFYKNKIVFLNSIYKKIIWFKKEFPRKRALDTWLMYFIALINDLKIISIRAICRKFAFSRGETKRILSYKTIIDKLEKKLKKRLSASCIYKLLEPLSYEVIFLLMAKSDNKVLHKNIRDFLNVYNGMRIHISGDDLVELGIPVGPNFKRILNKVLYAKLDKKINTKEEELSFVKKLIKR